jgi:hypothetical protein
MQKVEHTTEKGDPPPLDTEEQENEDEEEGGSWKSPGTCVYKNRPKHGPWRLGVSWPLGALLSFLPSS